MQSPEQMQGLAASWTVPFVARVYVEKSRRDGEQGERVRMLVPNKVMLLAWLNQGRFGWFKSDESVTGLYFATDGGK